MSLPGDDSNILIEQPITPELSQELSGIEPFFFDEDSELKCEELPIYYSEQLDSVDEEVDVSELGIDLDEPDNVEYSALEYLEIVGKIAAVGAFNWYGGGQMMALYSAGLATTALATAVYKYYDSEESEAAANAILKFELGVLKNYGMYLLCQQYYAGEGAFYPILTSAQSYLGLSDTFMKYFGVAIPLNLAVTFMAESYGFVQNKLYLEKETNGRVVLETDPFLSYRGPHTIGKRIIKNTFSKVLVDYFEITNEWNKIPFKLAGHYLANIPIALSYNKDNIIPTTIKTAITSSSKVIPEASSYILFNKAAEYLPKYFPTLSSVLVGTTTYIISKILTNTKGLD